MIKIFIPKIKLTKKDFFQKINTSFVDGKIAYNKIELNGELLNTIEEAIIKSTSLHPAKRSPLFLDLSYIRTGYKKPIRIEIKYDFHESTSYLNIHSTQKSLTLLEDHIKTTFESYKRIPTDLFIAVLLFLSAITIYLYPIKAVGLETLIVPSLSLIAIWFVNKLPHCYFKFSTLDPVKILLDWKVSYKDMSKILVCVLVMLTVHLADLRNTIDIYSSSYIKNKIQSRLTKNGIESEIQDLKKAITTYDSNLEDPSTRSMALTKMLIQMDRLIGNKGVFNNVPIDNLNIFVNSGRKPDLTPLT